jgi:hypothetical protein
MRVQFWQIAGNGESSGNVLLAIFASSRLSQKGRKMIEGRISKRRVLTLGADPEIFVYSGLKLKPAWEFLPAKGKDVMIYWDGAQAEWKYNHEGAHCQNNLVKYTRERLMELNSVALQADAKARLSLKNVVRVPQAVLDNAHPRHVELGCEPSCNAYDMRGKPVADPRKLPYRFAGGHFHFGTWTTQKPNYLKIVKTLDNILGVWSVGVARNMDNPIRRQYYGLAGEYRKPKYADGLGVEYRVLSNFWLQSPAVMQLTWDIGRLCVRLAHSRYGNLWAGNQDETIETINNCDFQQAEKIMKRNEPMFRWMLGQVYKKQGSIASAITLAYKGLAVDENFVYNWHFGDVWIPNAMQPWSRWE